ncbi:hypothetical protein HII36_00340 [Nonomuraea sp. NN258]|uniref:hypothetical protein n=1 Tax=Nonomuraea antri TaxID=2730852 RepID=UPI001569CD12|nr:hypothetical protein [Nonomuraea antri]NRQ30292.1 hypothetical protein [Nonomuraea antri]
MSFTGVKLPEFDMLISKHAAAAQRLDDLAARLHGELELAGLDTTPAVRIRKLAKEVSGEVSDLRRRQQLVRDLERREIIMGWPGGGGSTLLPMPDTLGAARGLLDGTLAADAATEAIAGTPGAAHRLLGFAGKGADPDFAQVLLTRLGAKGVTELPAALSLQLDGRQQDERPEKAMRMLAAVLARGTDPDNRAFMGESFLTELIKQARAEHRVHDVTYLGYQAQALIWQASNGKPPFSARFMQVVGQDVIDHLQSVSLQVRGIETP